MPAYFISTKAIMPSNYRFY